MNRDPWIDRELAAVLRQAAKHELIRQKVERERAELTRLRNMFLRDQGQVAS